MEKKTALITGSYGGLGTCFVNIHAGKGGDLILVGRSQNKLDEQAESVKKQYGVEVYTIAADLSQPDTPQMIYDTCKENGWQVDYLINNAGFGGQGMRQGARRGAAAAGTTPSATTRPNSGANAQYDSGASNIRPFDDEDLFVED